MAKLRKGLVSEFYKKQKDQAEQNRIRQKHGISDENVKVVEKSNTVKFLIRILVLVLKTAAWIALVTLAAVGVLCLVYPETRQALWNVLSGIADGTAQMLTNN